jgi:glycosyltransferase involved in cell wall biosynthesis
MIDLARWLRQNRSSLQAVYVLGLRHEAYVAVGALKASGIAVTLRCSELGISGDCAWQMTSHFGDRMRRRCQGADVVVVPNSLVQEELLGSGYARDLIHQIPDGVVLGPPRSADRRYRARAALAEANHDLAAAEYAPVVACVGRLVDAPMFSPLFLAWREIARRWPSAKLWLIGDGPARDALYDYIRDLDLHGQILMPGTFEDLSDVWLAADACVVPQPPSGCQQILSAMAAGLPIIAPDGPLVREPIQHQKQGLLISPQDRTGWFSALSQICEYPAVAQELGKGARAVVEQRFSSRAMAQRHLELWSELASRHHGGRERAVDAARPEESSDSCRGELR